MNYPNLKEEKKLWKKGFKRVACLDEAGRGPLAGPVVAAAVILNPKFKTLNPKQIQNSKFKCSKRFWILDFGHLDLFRISPQPLNKGWATQPISNGLWSDLGFRISKLRDSKKLSPTVREKFYKILTTHPRIWWGIGRVSEKVIDKINIKNAAELAMWQAIRRLKTKPDFLIIDGKYLKNYKLKTINYKLIVKADEKVFSCACASILAKVWRDRIMQRYDKKYPEYGFDLHKGYPTKLHLKMLKKYGPCKIHRKSFGPVIKMQKSKCKMQNDKSKFKKKPI